METVEAPSSILPTAIKGTTILPETFALTAIRGSSARTGSRHRTAVALIGYAMVLEAPAGMGMSNRIIQMSLRSSVMTEIPTPEMVVAVLANLNAATTIAIPRSNQPRTAQLIVERAVAMVLAMVGRTVSDVPLTVIIVVTAQLMDPSSAMTETKMMKMDVITIAPLMARIHPR
jgi:hypothetical protein